MSVNPVLHRPNRLKRAATTSAVIIGVSYFVLRTFPHLKTSIYDYIYPTQQDKVVEDDDRRREVIENEVKESEVSDRVDENEGSDSIVSAKRSDISQSVSDWSIEDLKSFLKEVRKDNNEFEKNILTS